MTNFILGAVSLYFLINIATSILVMVATWQDRKTWKLKRILFILFFGLFGLFFTACQDIF